jgi:hypothetical protein
MTRNINDPITKMPMGALAGGKGTRPARQLKVYDRLPVAG